ncbi:hypothetical protein [Deinococcus frigens]|uniref:hypothetical protein n=1 Tax=Deinococcus frigens TaxID=249403 RepID=UPI000494FC13|nr:hypothetical protein [Deinococcus frigens]
MRAFDLLVSEDEEELLAIFTVTLPYDPDTSLVLRGPYKGQDVAEAEISVSCELLEHFKGRGVMVVRQTVTLRPWWSWFTFTPARRLTPTRVFPKLGR